MVTCQSSELGWEVTVELPANFPSLGRGSVNRGHDTKRRQLRSRQIIEVATRDEWLDKLTRSLIRKIDIATKI